MTSTAAPLIGREVTGVSIRLFLADGRPDGLQIVEQSNWTGVALVSSRVDYPRMRRRDELSRPGVYVLLGPGLDGRQTVYVGEADETRSRLDDHHRNKDFWTKTIVFTSKDENLNKAHVRYLEARLVELARIARRSVLDNGTNPLLPRLSEADRADMERFLANMLVLYPVVGTDAFEIPSADEPGVAPHTLALRGVDAEARGREHADGFLVYAGARARAVPVPSLPPSVQRLRESLASAGLLRDDGDGLRLVEDHVFDSPSSAAALVLGRSANGRTEWKDGAGRTLKQLQAAALS